MLKGLKRTIRVLLKDNTIVFVLGYVFCLYNTRLLTGVTLEEYHILTSYAIKEDEKINK